jgi:hypothetical protein
VSSSILLRWGGLAAMVAGVLWIIFGVLNTQPLGTSHTTAPFAVRDPSLYRIYHLPAALATLLAAIGLLGLGRRLAQPANLPARVGAILAYIAAAAGAVNTLALAALVISLHFAGAMIGVFSLGIGTILIDGAALRNAGWRRWQALPLVVGVLGVLVFPISMLTFGGPVESAGVALIALFGSGWAAIGYALWSDGVEDRRVS